MKSDLIDIKSVLNHNLTYLKRNYHVTTLGVFGSMATGENTEESDIDILVTFSKPIGMFTFIELEDYLAQLLGRKVDLVTNKALKPIMKDEVLQQINYV